VPDAAWSAGVAVRLKSHELLDSVSMSLTAGPTTVGVAPTHSHTVLTLTGVHVVVRVRCDVVIVRACSDCDDTFAHAAKAIARLVAAYKLGGVEVLANCVEGHPLHERRVQIFVFGVVSCQDLFGVGMED
jgi:hypothetical protein